MSTWLPIILAVTAALVALAAIIGAVTGGGGSGKRNERGDGFQPRSTPSPDAYSGFPGFASGGLIPPNNPFLAVLGDNRSEPEVVSPVSTIEEAVARAMSNQPRNSGGMRNARPLVVNLILDGQRFGRATVPYINAETTRAGVNIVKK